VDDVQILKLASGLSVQQVDKAAHALGWPSLRTIALGGPGRVKWRNPWRNYYAAGGHDPDWEGLAALGLAETFPPPFGAEYTYWRVSKLGRLVLRVRLQAAILAREVANG
jgi:hypothetical protein